MARKVVDIQLGSTPVSEQALRLDAWSNLATGLGQMGVDSTVHLAPDLPLRLTEVDLNNVWRGDGFGRKIVEQPVYDGMRAGYVLNGLEENVEKAIIERIKQLKFEQNIRNWWRWGRLHGGAVIFLGINDGNTDLTVPFDSTRADYKIMFLKVFDRWRVNPYPEVDDNPSSPTFGQVMTYKIAPLSGGSFDCHRSRLIVYDGEPITDMERLRQNRWGDSCITACYQHLRSLQNVLLNTDHLVADMVQGVLKVEDLMNVIEAGQEGALIARLKLMDLTKGNLRTILTDKNEEYERITTTITGVEHIIDKMAEAAAATGNIPVKLFMGVAPKGLQATGDADIRQWYDFVHAQQESRYEPALRQVIDIIAGEMNITLSAYDIKFNPLWQQDAKEQADTRLAHAQTDQIYIMNNVLSPEEIRKQRFENPEYCNEVNGVDTIDLDLTPPQETPQEKGEFVVGGVGPTQEAHIPGPAPIISGVGIQQA